MGKDNKGGFWLALTEGFDAVKLLDNTNVYSVLLSETASNVFMSSMWQKVLNPYTLVVSGGDKMVVGNNITIAGLTRAFVGVVAGRQLIDRIGVDSTFVLAGMVGILGIVVNGWVLMHTSLTSIYWLNVVWAVFSGLWNSCMETEWARSLLKQKREDANNARQVLNKLTTAVGPVFSIALFYYVGGTTWTVPVLTFVMLIGTILTTIPVLLCFTFSRWYEVRQESHLCEISEIQFADTSRLNCQEITKGHFNTKIPGPVRITYPLSYKSKFGKLRVLTPNLMETKYMLGKQVMASLHKPNAEGVFEARAKNDETLAGIVDLSEPCIVHFLDRARQPVVVVLEDMVVYLFQDTGAGAFVDVDNSWMSFSLAPNLHKKTVDHGCFAVRGLRKVLFSKQTAVTSSDLNDLAAELLPASASPTAGGGRLSQMGPQGDSQRASMNKGMKPAKINMNMANCIVFCDVLNAVGSGMSLKFMDLFLITDYGISPVTLLVIAIVQNLAVVWLTPTVKQLMKNMRKRNLKGAISVSIVWGVSLLFLALICVPDQNFYVSVVSIVLMNSLSSCTKAYNRAKLVNSLPHNRVANYMVWDSLNKANQGGIAVFGGQIAHVYGYRGCFVVTLVILTFRWCVWTGYLFSRGCRRKAKVTPSEEGVASEEAAVEEEEIDAKYGIYETTDLRPEEVGSELFAKRSISYLAGDNQMADGSGHFSDALLRHTIPQASPDLMVVDEGDETEWADADVGSPSGTRKTGGSDSSLRSRMTPTAVGEVAQGSK